MSYEQLRFKRKKLGPLIAKKAPSFGSPTVLAADPWDFVSLWLRRKKKDEAFFYWEQARQFHQASQGLDPVALPLTSYYSFLNAVKALLVVHGCQFSEHHGLHGRQESTGRTALKNEVVEFKKNGVFRALATYFGDKCAFPELTLEQILISIPAIHRAFTLSFTASPEVFLPLQHPSFVTKKNSTQAWFAAELPSKYRRNDIKKVLPDGFELDEGVETPTVVRRKQRFSWKPGAPSLRGNLSRLRNYHERTRKSVVPIVGSPTTWYLRKRLARLQGIECSQVSLMFAAMHRLGELSRYSPLSMQRHLECQHNWLLSEFLSGAPSQFVGRVASEITGQQFAVPYAAQY